MYDLGDGRRDGSAGEAGLAKRARATRGSAMTTTPARRVSGLWKRLAAAESKAEQLAEIQAFAATRCGAYARTTGHPCRAPRVPGKRRCRMHGGLSTGPKTLAGKLRALANLKQFRSEAAPVTVPRLSGLDSEAIS